MTTPQQMLADWPSVPELRRRCRLLTRTVPEIVLGGKRLVIHDVAPNFIQLGHRVREHVHSFYEGHILLSGSANYLTGGEQLMGPGGALLHGPNTPHTWQEPETPCLRLLVWFSMEPAVVVPRPAQWPLWPDLLWDVALLLEDAAGTRPGWADRLRARLTTVVSRLLTIADWPPDAQPVMLPPSHPLAGIDQFLRDNLAWSLTLSDIADHAGVSHRSLCRQFLQMNGTTVMEYLFTLRMDRAAALLAETDASLSDIAAQIGILDTSYFCKRFRRHFHLTPGVYRQQNRR